MSYLDWGLSRAHQPAKHTDYINCFWLLLSLSHSFSLSLLFWIAVSYLCISSSPCLVNTDLPTGLCFPQTQSRHTSTRGVSFILYHMTREMSAGHAPLSLSVSPSISFCANMLSSIAGSAAYCSHYTKGQKTVTEKNRWRKEKMNESYKERAHADMLICVMTSKCVYREGAGESEVIICKKWITLRLDCWAHWRAAAQYALQARAHSH